MCVSGDCEACTRAHEFERANEELQGQVEELQAALSRILNRRRRPDESVVAHFDRLAERFYRATLVMAPGKSQPMEAHDGVPDQERQARWDAWLREPYEEAAKILAEATP